MDINIKNKASQISSSLSDSYKIQDFINQLDLVNTGFTGFKFVIDCYEFNIVEKQIKALLSDYYNKQLIKTNQKLTDLITNK